MKNFKILKKVIFSGLLLSFSFSQSVGYFITIPSCVVSARASKKEKKEKSPNNNKNKEKKKNKENDKKKVENKNKTNVEKKKQNKEKKEESKEKHVEKKVDGYNINSGDVEISALNGAVLLDVNTNEILFSKGEINEDGEHKVAQMASTTKIMTAVIALENYPYDDMDTLYEVDEETIQVEGTSMGLREGDRVSMRSLLYGLLLQSGNDAANEIALRVIKKMVENGKLELDEEKEKPNVKECIAKFVEIMNNKAKELGLNDIKFSSPSGLGPEDVLYDKRYDQNETSARDLALLASYALKKEEFKKVCSSPKKQVVIENENEPTCPKRTYFNHNKLVKEKSGFYYKYACGVKTGFTKEAGRCLVAAAEKNGVLLVAVVLKDKNDWTDCIRLFNYGFSKYEEVDIKKEIPEKDRIENVKFKDYGLDGKDVFFKVKEEDKKISLNLRKNKKSRGKTERKIIANPVQFNVKKGEEIGKVEYYNNGRYVGESKIFVDEIIDWNINIE